MKKNDLNFTLNQNLNVDLESFLLSLFTVIILSLVVQFFYNKYSNSISNKNSFSKNFVILGLATCLVITIVKSSLALSLGLVGALSIVRFRTAIKDPEELTYLFLIIAIGLGCGANQITITFLGTATSLFTIFVYKKFIPNYYPQNNNDELTNMSIVIDEKLDQESINNIIYNDLKSIEQIKFLSLTKEENSLIINFELKTKNFKNLTKIINDLEKKFKKCKIVISSYDDLAE